VRIATWNVNGLRARLEFVLAWLAERQPDVVGLQELKLTDDQLPQAEFEALGYHVLCHGQKAWNGVAILSREEGSNPLRGLAGQEDFGARLIAAEVGGLVFTTVYCPNGKALDHPDFARKLAWFDALRGHLDRHCDPSAAIVLCGDFNVCPSDLDSWNPEPMKGQIFHTDEERKRLDALSQWGLVDLYRRLHPDTQAFSWWDYRGGAFHRGHGLRIDFLLASPSLAERVQTVEIDRDWRKKKDGLTASDHAPVVAELAPGTDKSSR
jgi:exodeoxyribonuclease-3